MSLQLRGERFNVDLPSDDEEEGDGGKQPVSKIGNSNASSGFVKDISERAAPRVPTAPVAKATSTGFPAHKKRAGVSRFKQQREQGGKTDGQFQGRRATFAADAPVGSIDAMLQGSSNNKPSEQEEIDKENKEKLSKMSDEEIAVERQELMQQLSPSLIGRLLRRANIDEPQATDFPTDQAGLNATGDISENLTAETESTPEDKPQPAIHFPRPPNPAPLDPSSPDFLAELHEKYFPNLPHDPSKLEWMSPSSSSTNTQTANSYAASASSLPISALRFSFTGALLPPSLSNSIPTSKGLHHHGDSPESAGYTIAELAHLARSSFPTQRCFAFQTLGRVLYRLGIGEFGKLERGFQGGGIPRDPDEENDNGTMDDEQSLDNLAKGLWDCIREGRVLETLEREAGREGGHVSAKAYATEALWLWRKGGGTEVRAT